MVNQTKSDIERLSSEARELSKSLSDDHSTIASSLGDLKSECEALEEIVGQTNSAKSVAETQLGKTTEYLNLITETRERFENLNSETGSQYDSLVARQNQLQNKISEIEAAHSSISDLHRKLLVTSEENVSVEDKIATLQEAITSILNSTESKSASMTQDHEDLRKKLEGENKKFKETTEKQFETLRTSLEDKILALLPSAGAAGLASTYFDAKSRYAPTSFAGKPNTPALTGIRKLRPYVGNNPSGLFAPLFFYALFLAPLGLLAWGTFDLVHKIELHVIELDYRIFILRILVALPLATISGFGFTSLRLYRRLFEEYNHKQRVMELYRSFKNEIETNGDDEQAKTLLNIMLDSVSKKAWDTSDKPDEETPKENLFSNPEQIVEFVTKLKSL